MAKMQTKKSLHIHKKTLKKPYAGMYGFLTLSKRFEHSITKCICTIKYVFNAFITPLSSRFNYNLHTSLRSFLFDKFPARFSLPV